MNNIGFRNMIAKEIYDIELQVWHRGLEYISISRNLIYFNDHIMHELLPTECISF